MSLEGRLRELGLPEVLQLLGLSRKSGRLVLHAPLQGRAAFVQLTNGAITDAAQWRINAVHADQAPGARGLAFGENASKAVESCVLDLVRWRDGEFRFNPDVVGDSSAVRLVVEMLLMESAQHAERWERLGDRLTDAHAVPAFVDVEPQQLPLLRLVPQEWEILTRVDGQRDLTELATVLGREVLDVAEIVHGLIGSGLLTLRESERAPRRFSTPPSGNAVPGAPGAVSREGPSRDLWIPSHDESNVIDAEIVDDDSIFDPIEVGVLTPEGLPQRFVATARVNTVATAPAEPSLLRGDAVGNASDWDAATWCSHGDDAARRGDLSGALQYWSAALRSDAAMAEADRIREAIALAARLHALLHPAAPRA